MLAQKKPVTALTLGINSSWSSLYFQNIINFKNQLIEDFRIRFLICNYIAYKHHLLRRLVIKKINGNYFLGVHCVLSIPAQDLYFINWSIPNFKYIYKRNINNYIDINYYYKKKLKLDLKLNQNLELNKKAKKEINLFLIKQKSFNKIILNILLNKNIKKINKNVYYFNNITKIKYKQLLKRESNIKKKYLIIYKNYIYIYIKKKKKKKKIKKFYIIKKKIL